METLPSDWLAHVCFLLAGLGSAAALIVAVCDGTARRLNRYQNTRHQSTRRHECVGRDPARPGSERCPTMVPVSCWQVWQTARAERRARQVLRSLLTPTQITQWAQMRTIDVPSQLFPGRIYRIPQAGMVRVYEQGREVMQLCLQPANPLPESDVVAMHLLLLSTAEEQYLRSANQFQLAWPRRVQPVPHALPSSSIRRTAAALPPEPPAVSTVPNDRRG